MPEEYLQAAFEIKASCDEISRRILRWHWESKPGGHGFDALLEHVRRRQEESPAYYGHMPDVGRKTSWQQLDTTLCMRVLLDPENDAAQPLDLLGNTAHPGAARRACNAVRTARNEAAHASDRSSGGQAGILFDEGVEGVEGTGAAWTVSTGAVGEEETAAVGPPQPDRSSSPAHRTGRETRSNMGKTSFFIISIPWAGQVVKPGKSRRRRLPGRRIWYIILPAPRGWYTLHGRSFF